jgi:hypothetical protein
MNDVSMNRHYKNFGDDSYKPDLEALILISNSDEIIHEVN